MSEKMPYQPSEEEIQKAEEMMTDKQSELSELRKNMLEGGPTPKDFDRRFEKGVRFCDRDGHQAYVEVLEDGSIKLGEWYGSAGSIKGGMYEGGVDKALVKLEEALADYERKIKEKEEHLEYLKTVKDKIGIMKKRALNFKKQEKKEN